MKKASAQEVIDHGPTPIRQYETIINGQRVVVKVYAPGAAEEAQTAESWRGFNFGSKRIPTNGGYQKVAADQSE